MQKKHWVFFVCLFFTVENNTSTQNQPQSVIFYTHQRGVKGWSERQRGQGRQSSGHMQVCNLKHSLCDSDLLRRLTMWKHNLFQVCDLCYIFKHQGEFWFLIGSKKFSFLSPLLLPRSTPCHLYFTVPLTPSTWYTIFISISPLGHKAHSTWSREHNKKKHRHLWGRQQ